VAIVVGAGGELGRATARTLADAGYMVAGVDRNEQGLKELPDGIGRTVGDATDPAAAKSLIDRIATETGPPEVLVNRTAGTRRRAGGDRERHRLSRRRSCRPRQRRDRSGLRRLTLGHAEDRI
jgi:NAD(P)-dependent dehydrogenase (short-subunit alcohol dehydrogenase family)